MSRRCRYGASGERRCSFEFRFGFSLWRGRGYCRCAAIPISPELAPIAPAPCALLWIALGSRNRSTQHLPRWALPWPPVIPCPILCVAIFGTVSMRFGGAGKCGNEFGQQRKGRMRRAETRLGVQNPASRLNGCRLPACGKNWPANMIRFEQCGCDPSAIPHS